MTANATDPRTTVAQWNEASRALVFRGTTVPLAAMWEHLRQGQTPNDFINQHPTVPAIYVLDVLRIAGELLCEWPDTKEQQIAAHARALKDGDVRFLSGTMKYLPGVRGGNLLCGSTGVRAEVVWENLSGGATFEDIEYQYSVASELVIGLINLAEAFFAKGQEPGANLSRQ